MATPDCSRNWIRLPNCSNRWKPIVPCVAAKIQAEVEHGLNRGAQIHGCRCGRSHSVPEGRCWTTLCARPISNPEVRSQLRDRIVIAMREASRSTGGKRRGATAGPSESGDRRRSAAVGRRIDRPTSASQAPDGEVRRALVDEGIGLALAGENIAAEENFDCGHRSDRQSRSKICCPVIRSVFRHASTPASCGN